MNSGWVRFCVGAGILFMGAGIFYNLAIFAPSIKRQEMNEKNRIQEAKESKEAVEKLDRAICKATAEDRAIEMFKDRRKESPGMYTATFGNSTYLTSDYEIALKQCLQGCGLEK